MGDDKQHGVLGWAKVSARSIAKFFESKVSDRNLWVWHCFIGYVFSVFVFAAFYTALYRSDRSAFSFGSDISRSQTRAAKVASDDRTAGLRRELEELTRAEVSINNSSNQPVVSSSSSSFILAGADIAVETINEPTFRTPRSSALALALFKSFSIILALRCGMNRIASKPSSTVFPRTRSST